MKINIVILGDICPQWGFPELFSTGSAERVFNDILPYLHSADYVVANLEAPVTSASKKLNKNSVNLKADPSDITVLHNAGVKAVALANNHILDYGKNGLNDTVKHLSDKGICYYGAGSIEEAAIPHIIELSGVKIGFLAFAEQEFNCAVDYGIGANLWDDFDSIKTIHDSKNQCDYLIVQYHGGIEHYIYPSPLLQKKCRAMADAGADFVTCQHSHCIGTREVWNQAEILYGQGNTVFGYRENNDQWNQGLVCKIEIDTETLEPAISYIPISSSVDGEHFVDDNQANEILDRFEVESEKIKERRFISENWIRFCLRQSNDYLPMLFGWSNNMIRANRVLKGRLIKLFVRLKQRRNAMNLIRCDAHREVLSTILGKDFFDNNQDILGR